MKIQNYMKSNKDDYHLKIKFNYVQKCELNHIINSIYEV